MDLSKRCEAIKLDLFPFIKGEMGTAGRKTLEDHVKGCSSCAEALAETRRVHNALDADACLSDVGEESLDRLLMRVRLYQHEKKSRLKKRAAGIGALLVAVVGGACLLWLIGINDRVLPAFRETLAYLGISMPWLTEGPLSGFLAPLLFIGLCSIMTLVASFVLLRRKKTRAEASDSEKSASSSTA